MYEIQITQTQKRITYCDCNCQNLHVKQYQGRQQYQINRKLILRHGQQLHNTNHRRKVKLHQTKINAIYLIAVVVTYI